jgi:hypothetical protein
VVRASISDLCSLFQQDPQFVEAARPNGIIDTNGNRRFDPEESVGLIALANTNEYVGTLVKGLFEKRFGAGALEKPEAPAQLQRLAQLERGIRCINIPRMDRIGKRLCTDPEFDHRWAASPKYDNVARFFADEFRKIGFRPAGEIVGGRRTYFDTIEYEQRFLRERGQMASTKNVYAVLPGTERDPEKKKTILIVVHADAISAAEMEDYGRQRFPNHEHQGANDNAAACAATLEFCRIAKMIGGFKDDVMVWVTSAEEDGLLGTEAACVKPPIEPDEIRSAFVLEMIGRNAVDDLYVFGGETRENIEANRFDDRVVRVAEEAGIGVKRGKPLIEDRDHWCVRSDWEVLENFGVQIAGIFGGADPTTYHTLLDTWDKINLEKLRTVVELMLRTCQDLDDDSNPPERSRPAAADLNPHFPGAVRNPIG